MKDILVKYAGYNVWANQQLSKCMLVLTSEQQHKEVSSSFNNIYTTFLHMWDAEAIWWQRVTLQEQLVIPSLSPSKPSMQEITEGLLKQSQQWEEWIINASERALFHEFTYRNFQKEQFKQPVFEVLLQVFNHATYHRGQLVTISRQLGVSHIPQTDFIIWTRSKK